MTRIYVMESCLDCAQAKQLYGDNPDYEIIDIGKQARNLNTHPVLHAILTVQVVRGQCCISQHDCINLYRLIGKITLAPL